MINLFNAFSSVVLIMISYNFSSMDFSFSNFLYLITSKSTSTAVFLIYFWGSNPMASYLSFREEGSLLMSNLGFLVFFTLSTSLDEYMIV